MKKRLASMRRNVRASSIGIALLLGACAPPADVKPEINSVVVEAASTILPEGLERHVRELSSDAYEGRGPGTQGDLKTQAYLIEQLKNLGLQPGDEDGDWLQHFDLVGMEATQPQQWTFTKPLSEEQVELAQSSDFIVAAGEQKPTVAVQQAPLVFVGYGIQAPEYHWDDYKGVDLEGKIMVVLNNDPDWSQDLFEGDMRLYYGRWVYKYEMAARLRAAGAIIIHTDYSAGYPWQVVQTSWSGPQFELPNEGEPTTQVKGWVTESAAKQLFELAGLDLAELTERSRSREFAPVDMGISTSIELPVTMQRTQTANVLGLLPGDTRAGEVVVYSAHHDHLGMVNHSETRDGIYNGAMDNATGVSSLLNIAGAFGHLPKKPRRSVLFALVGAEEQGLLGSLYYSKYPTFAPGKIVANINMDGGQVMGRTRDVSYIGYGRSDLDAIADQVAAFQGREVVGDQYPSAGYFYRSDHFSFARIGVPSINFRGGDNMLDGGLARGRAIRKGYIARTYHQPADEVTDEWRFEGLAEDAQFGFLAGYLIAMGTDMPRWRAGDEFAAARLEALTE